jgi:large subunit ribosomal protein L25
MALESININTMARLETGKSPCKRLRKSGRIPCILFGHGVIPLSLSVDKKEILSIIDHPSIINLTVQGHDDTRNVLIKQVQLDYLGTNVIHVDFQQIRMDESITVDIPLEVIGQPIGLQFGGQLDQVLHTILVECLPALLPDKLVYDVSHMNVDDSLPISKLPLPDGVRAVYTDPHIVVVHVLPPQVAEDETESTADQGVKSDKEPEVITKGKKEEGKDGKQK